MSFLIKNYKFFKKDNIIWGTVSNNSKKEYGSKLIDNGKYLKTTIKSYEDKINTNICNEEPKEGFLYIS